MVLTRSGVGALVVGAFAVGYTAGTAINAAYECYLLAPGLDQYPAGLDQFAGPACPARLLY